MIFGTSSLFLASTVLLIVAALLVAGGLTLIVRLRRQLARALRDTSVRQLETNQKIAEILTRMEQRFQAHDTALVALKTAQMRLHDAMSEIMVRLDDGASNLSATLPSRTVH